ncbi:cytidylate kinase-like family protein [bacterium]|nr:cytidylate kinase-like family protein [bacterium]
MSSPVEQPAFHGYAPQHDTETYRPPLSIVISRESGSRGRSIAERVAELLGWGYLDQESLEYLTQGAPAGTHGRAVTSDPTIHQWVDARLDELNKDGSLLRAPQVTSLVRHILETAALSHCVILARGAGRVLPPDSRLHVKIVAPLENRIAYIAQINRLSSADAKQFIVEKDRARQEFLADKSQAEPADLSEYDVVINTVQLGVEASARLIAAAAREKIDFLQQDGPVEKSWRVGMP